MAKKVQENHSSSARKTAFVEVLKVLGDSAAQSLLTDSEEHVLLSMTTNLFSWAEVFSPGIGSDFIKFLPDLFQSMGWEAKDFRPITQQLVGFLALRIKED